MFSYNVFRNLDNFFTIIDFDQTKFLVGSFFDEITLIKSFEEINNLPEENEIRPNLYKILIEQKDKYYDLFAQVDYFLITTLNDILYLPFIIKRIDNFKGKIFASEPVKQIAKYYLKEFYYIFNSIFSKLGKFSSKTNKDDIIKCEEVYGFITEIEINLFVENIQSLIFNEKIYVKNHLYFKAVSSEFNLGSCIYAIGFFDKTICVLKEFSLYEYRYPKEIDLLNVGEVIDYLIHIPTKTLKLREQPEDYYGNTQLNYSNEITKIFESLYKIISKSDINSLNYPKILIVADNLFILEIVDFLIYKLPKEAKTIYFSKTIKSVIEYANVSHSYIKDKYHNKILDFEYPFQFDKLLPKNDLSLLNTFLENKKASDSNKFSNNCLFLFEELNSYLKQGSLNSISNKDSPLIYIVDAFSMCYGDSKLIYDSFKVNFNGSDAIIYTKPSYQYEKAVSNAKIFSFNIDYNHRLEDLKQLLGKICVKNYFYFDEFTRSMYFCKQILSNESIKNMNKKSYSLNIPNNIVLKDLFYDNVYVLVNEEEGIDNKSLILKQENNRILISMKGFNEEGIDLNSNEMIDEKVMKLELNEFLKFNSMWVESINTGDNSLTILIDKANSELPSAKITLKKSDQYTFPEVDITTNNLEDTSFLNELISCLLIN